MTLTTTAPAGKHTSLANAAWRAFEAAPTPQHLLHMLREGYAPADALHDALQLVLATGDAERAKGFCRLLQKHLERAAR
jgi:hypothetical protein